MEKLESLILSKLSWMKAWKTKLWKMKFYLKVKQLFLKQMKTGFPSVDGVQAMEIEANDPAEENLILLPVSGKRMLLMQARLVASLEKSKACEKENVSLGRVG